MTYIEELRTSLNKPQVAFQEFALSTRILSEHLFCFFEGKDNAYYVPRIKRFTDKYHPINCAGRDKVLGVYRLITNRPEYNHYKKAFFIDRDFNQTLKPTSPPIFETPCYSIENFYVSVDVFKDILTNEFHLSEIGDKEVFELCTSTYAERQQEFHKATMLFNAWYACLVEIRNTTNELSIARLQDKLPKELKLEISLKSVISDCDLETIKRLFPNAAEVNSELLNAKLESFKDCECHKVFRGKYEMQFLINLIQLLLQDSLRAKTVLKSKVNFTFGDGSGINNEQAISIFAGYAETPDSLLAYLEQVIL
jgi:hypothetical protein